MLKSAISVVGFVVLAVAVTCAFGLATPRDLKIHPQCLHCGMSRKECAHTRISVEYRDGTKGGECSLRCLVATFMEQPGREPKKILASDYNDKTLAQAEKSWWVRYDNAVECRGSKVMLAFRSEEGADKFIASFGGRKLSFDEALKITYFEIEEGRLSGKE
ncbi:nitrous oxide reductase accessory protein NosL [Geobacter sp. DSM 9736]|uniref:nitrous oxide reductase accessory protein NosL n=1 Tax=Geobacter sp. DSM 9736 TaxID=1277350 RepID=UPI000B50BC21|nr:nitrous oxide reductase accessory protein NosL [Geobacter sp. DSM 9736]SNB45518.1 Nitrous oxide reductase accessory protein NosL [Geobacter sp. DSM 9736]